MKVCPRNAHHYGHAITDEKAAAEWCQRTQKGQHCEGCERNKITVAKPAKVQKKTLRMLW